MASAPWIGSILSDRGRKVGISDIDLLVFQNFANALFVDDCQVSSVLLVHLNDH